jgi:hypothetical protein
MQSIRKPGAPAGGNIKLCRESVDVYGMTAAASTLDETRCSGFGHSRDADARTAGAESVRAALGGSVPAAGDLVIVFPSATYDLEALHRGALEAAAPAAVVGCTTVGAFTAEAQVESGCVAAFLAADGISFGVCHVERVDDDVAESTRRAAMLAHERAGERHPHSVLMLLCDGLTPDQRALARGAYEAASAVVPIVGGAAGDDLAWRATYTFGEERLLSNGLVAVWINSARPMAVAVGHGWSPFSRPMLVTRADGPVMYELDGLPALDAYLAVRGATLLEHARSFGEQCSERPLGIPNAKGGYDLRQIHETVPGGGLVLTTAVPEQTVVQVMASDVDALLEGARATARDAVERLGGAPRFALVFSCCTRAPLLGDRIAEEVAEISASLGGVPAGGFYTCGEFARVPGATGIHNSSVAILVL